MAGNTTVRRGLQFKGMRATELQSDELRVAILPDLGAKVASIFSKSVQAELLWQYPGETLVRPAFGAAFGAEAGWGFDEMFPAILPSIYPDGPWRGTPIPDHGEVWSLPWNERLDGNRVEHTVHGLRFPYRLTRNTLLEGATLRLDYHLENLSSFPFRCMWAAHPLFVTARGSRIELPEGIGSIVNAQTSPGLTSYGARYSFPHPEGSVSAVDLREIPPIAQRGSWKWWVEGELSRGWCVLRSTAAGYLVRLAFPVDKVPYLGIWVNNGDWNQQFNCGIEPATGGMDGIDLARLFGVEHILKPYAEEEWHLLISVETI